MSEQGDDRGFQVRDRRRFTESGETREDGNEPASSAATSSPEPAPEPPPGQSDVGQELPPITLTAFVMSLSSQALLCMGELEDPNGGQAHLDLAAASELIDILAMLKEKTRGNLDPTESGLLDGILYDLRMRYVGKVRG